MAKDKAQEESVIIVLGGSNDPDGTLHTMSLDRCRETLQAHQEFPQHRILPTGGFGPHFNEGPTAHGELVRHHLIQAGISSNQFFPIAKSAYTKDDAEKSAEVLGGIRLKQIILITSDFHMDRALHFFERVFSDVPIQARPARSTLSAETLAQKVAHEKKRLAQIRMKRESEYDPQ